MSQSEFESPLMPRELADAPHIENVPVAEGMHTITKAVLEVHEELRQVRKLLADVGEPERLRERIARLSDDSVREAIRVALRDAGHAFTPRPALEEAIARIVAIVADDDAHPHDARPAAQDAPAEAPGGVGTSGGGTGGQGGDSLGEALRSAADYQDRPGAYQDLLALADRADATEASERDAWSRYHDADRRADALERERDQWRAEALKAQEDHGDLIIDLRNVREPDGLESVMRTSAGARMRDWLVRRLGGAQ